MNKKVFSFLIICLFFIGVSDVYANEFVDCTLIKENGTNITYTATFNNTEMIESNLTFRYPIDREVVLDEEDTYLSKNLTDNEIASVTVSTYSTKYDFNVNRFNDTLLNYNYMAKYYSSNPLDLVTDLTNNGFTCKLNGTENNTSTFVNNYVNEETNFKALIEDDANLLTDEEKTKLLDNMIPLTKYGHIAFKSIDSNYTSTEYYAREYYHTTFGTQSGTVFVIDMHNRNIFIFSDGNNYKVITTDKANIITDNIYTYATREEYYECASKAFRQMYTLLEGGKIAEPMRYISNMLISITLGAFISFGIVTNATKLKPARDNEILKNCDITFEAGNVNVRKSGQHRVYSPRSDSSSGGSSGGGGGGGGGGSSGGGGGHSF